MALLKHTCPRRVEGPAYATEAADEYSRDGTCTYCGSLDPDAFMARLELGDVELEPTDKNYKVYLTNKGGAKFSQTHRTDSKPFQGWGSPEHDWVTVERDEAKFYFQHLSEPQKRRFIELLNQGKVRFGPPGHFYRKPFFIS